MHMSSAPERKVKSFRQRILNKDRKGNWNEIFSQIHLKLVCSILYLRIKCYQLKQLWVHLYKTLTKKINFLPEAHGDNLKITLVNLTAFYKTKLKSNNKSIQSWSLGKTINIINHTMLNWKDHWCISLKVTKTKRVFSTTSAKNKFN